MSAVVDIFYPFRDDIIEKAFHFLKDKEVENQIILFITDDKVEILDITASHSLEAVDYSLEFLLQNKERLVGKNVYIAHNHPSGDLKPSMGDYAASKDFASLLRLNNINLKEEFIVTKDGVSSFSSPPHMSPSFFLEFSEKSKNGSRNPRDTFHVHKITEEQKSDENVLKQSMLQEINEGNEVAFSNTHFFAAKKFTFEELLYITNKIEEVVVFGFPSNEGKRNWERILDINNVFGSIESYAVDHLNQLIAMKKEMVI